MVIFISTCTSMDHSILRQLRFFCTETELASSARVLRGWTEALCRAGSSAGAWAVHTPAAVGYSLTQSAGPREC